MTSDDNIDQLLNELTENIPQELIGDPVPSHELKNVGSSNVEGIELQDPPNFDEILSVDESLITPTSHNVSVINSACQQVLKDIEHQLLVLLKKNRKEQEIVQGFLNSNCKNFNVDSVKKTSLKCAGMPYFKDPHGFQPPPNEDVLRKQNQNKLLPVDFINNSPTWNSADAKALTKAVNNFDITKPSSIDWMKIAATHMEGKYSPSECKSKWLMNLNPNINRSRWGIKEMAALRSLSKKYNYQNWDLIALELETNRTGLQCCIQYMTNTFPTQGKWTVKEDETLQELVEKYKIKDFIPWAKVAWHFESRSAKQCQERYAYHLGDIKKGSFTPDEDFLIVYLASKLKNFGEVAKLLPNRVATQVRSRYEYLVHLSMPQFSKEEDELLTQLMVLYPRDWGKISSHFLDRSSIQCRRRWGYLQRKIKLSEHPQSESENDEACDSPAENSESLEKNTIDAENYYKLNKNVYPRPKASQKEKKPSEPYEKLLHYHKNSHKFYYGPKPRISLNPEDQEKLNKKMMVAMKTLAVDHKHALSAFNTETLSNDCEFDKEDFGVLSGLKRNEMGGLETTKKIIPPNYMTLVGLRSLTLNWAKIKNLPNFYNQQCSSSAAASQNASGDRLLCSDAKKLFKSRLKALFAFPLILSNITPSTPTTVHKPKPRKKAKPLSKHRRKEHAKLMNAAYREKLKALKEKLPESNDEDICEREDSFGSTDIINKCQSKGKTKCSTMAAVKAEDKSDADGSEPPRKKSRLSKNQEFALKAKCST